MVDEKKKVAAKRRDFYIHCIKTPSPGILGFKMEKII